MFNFFKICVPFAKRCAKNFSSRLRKQMLVKYTPGVIFFNILHKLFWPIFLCQKITKLNVTIEKLLNSLLYEKCEHKMLMKYTPGVVRLLSSSVVTFRISN